MGEFVYEFTYSTTVYDSNTHTYPVTRSQLDDHRTHVCNKTIFFMIFQLTTATKVKSKV